MGDHDADVEAILARRHDNGADYWATPDARIYVGNPFSTLTALAMLHELGVDSSHEAVSGALALILAACRDDGRIRLAPKAPLYPCYTAEAARVLCRYGRQDALERTVSYLLENIHESGGWRCSFTKFGKGPETEYASPGATLYALDVLRFFPDLRAGVEAVDEGVEALLRHWESREPIGPCHHGIGTLFLQVEYPFIRYNLFYYVYVLSFFARATRDVRFSEAHQELKSRLTEDGQVVVERPHRGLKGLLFCARGEASPLATDRYREIAEKVAA